MVARVMVISNALAVLGLTTNSELVGCSTGILTGLARTGALFSTLHERRQQ